MTDAEIRKTAAGRLARNSGDCVSLMVFQFSLITFMMLSETMMYLSLRRIGNNDLYSVKALLGGSGSAWTFWVCKTMMEFSLAAPCFALVRRMYLDVAMGSEMKETRRYISAHSVKYYSGAFYASFMQLVIKLTALTPGIISACGAYYFAQEIRLNELNSRVLFALTGCLGITAIWGLLASHYFISLALTPYIMSLDPRANVLDACDLSVRLMDGKHGRYLGFIVHFLRFLPAVLMVYPFFAVYPYFKVSYSLFMYELIGEKKRDKMAGMIKRWKKYL